MRWIRFGTYGISLAGGLLAGFHWLLLTVVLVVVVEGVRASGWRFIWYTLIVACLFSLVSAVGGIDSPAGPRYWRWLWNEWFSGRMLPSWHVFQIFVFFVIWTTGLFVDFVVSRIRVEHGIAAGLALTSFSLFSLMQGSGFFAEMMAAVLSWGGVLMNKRIAGFFSTFRSGGVREDETLPSGDASKGVSDVRAPELQVRQIGVGFGQRVGAVPPGSGTGGLPQRLASAYPDRESVGREAGGLGPGEVVRLEMPESQVGGILIGAEVDLDADDLAEDFVTGGSGGMTGPGVLDDLDIDLAAEYGDDVDGVEEQELIEDLSLGADGGDATFVSSATDDGDLERTGDLRRLDAAWDALTDNDDPTTEMIDGFVRILALMRPSRDEFEYRGGFAPGLVDLASDVGGRWDDWSFESLFDRVIHAVKRERGSLHVINPASGGSGVGPAANQQVGERPGDGASVFRVRVPERMPAGEFGPVDKELYELVSADMDLLELAVRSVFSFDLTDASYLVAVRRLGSVLGSDWRKFSQDRRALSVFLGSVEMHLSPGGALFEGLADLDVDMVGLVGRVAVLADFGMVRERLMRLRRSVSAGIDDIEDYRVMLLDRDGLEFVLEGFSGTSPDIAELYELWRNAMASAERKFGLLVESSVVEVSEGAGIDPAARDRGFAHILSLGMPTDEREEVAGFMDLAGAIRSVEDRISRESVVLQVDKSRHVLFDALMVMKQDALRRARMMHERVRRSGGGESRLRVLLSSGETDAGDVYRSVMGSVGEIESYVSGVTKLGEDNQRLVLASRQLEHQNAAVNERLLELEKVSHELAESDSLPAFARRLQQVFTPSSQERVHGMSAGVTQLKELSVGPARLFYETEKTNFAFVLLHGHGRRDWMVQDSRRLVSESLSLSLDLVGVYRQLVEVEPLMSRPVAVRVIVIHGGVSGGLGGVFSDKDALAEAERLIVRAGFDDVLQKLLENESQR